MEIAKILNHSAIHWLQVNTTFERWKKKIGQMMIMRSHTTNIGSGRTDTYPKTTSSITVGWPYSEHVYLSPNYSFSAASIGQ